MKAIEAARREGVAIEADRSIHDAAVLMGGAGVGALAVTDGDQLVGMVTDRDLVRRGIAKSVASEARVDSLMSTPVVSIDADADVREAFTLFRTNAVRRLPVLRGGKFVAMITLDDLLINVAADLADLSRPVTGEVIFGHHDSAVPATAPPD